MRLFGFLRRSEPPRPIRRTVKPWNPDDLTDEQRAKLIDLMVCSDMESGHERVACTEAALDLIDSVSR